MDYYIFECPNCSDLIIIYKNEFNCKIFRHGVYKINMEQINPHASEHECINLKNNDKIYGCGKPFKIMVNNDKVHIEQCHYV